MRWIPIRGPVIANDPRSLELISMHYVHGSLELCVVEDPSGNRWTIKYDNVVAHRATGWDVAGAVMRGIEDEGGLFEAEDSELLLQLGKPRVSILSPSRHFLVCCYDDVVEIVADRVNYQRVSDDQDMEDANAAQPQSKSPKR